MKKRKIGNKKLMLKKENIVNLNQEMMNSINGGEDTDATLSIWGCETNLKSRGNECCAPATCVIMYMTKCRTINE